MRYKLEGTTKRTFHFGNPGGNQAFGTIEADNLQAALQHAMTEKTAVEWHTIKDMDGNYLLEKVAGEWMTPGQADKKREEINNEIPDVFK